MIFQFEKYHKLLFPLLHTILKNQFELEDLIIVERDKDGTKFKKLEIQEYEGWLEDYSTGELWEKNILGGRPTAW